MNKNLKTEKGTKDKNNYSLIFDKPVKSIGVFIVVLLLVSALLGGLLKCKFFNWSNGTNDGWLGFWGGYLGSAIAIIGVGWTLYEGRKNLDKSLDEQKRELDSTNGNQRDLQVESLKEDKESQFRISRPFFVLKESSLPIILGNQNQYYLSEKLKNSSKDVAEYFSDTMTKENIVSTIDICNLSIKRMMAVYVEIHYFNGKTDDFRVDIIDSKETAHLISFSGIEKYISDKLSYLNDGEDFNMDNLNSDLFKEDVFDEAPSKKRIEKLNLKIEKAVKENFDSSVKKIDIFFTTELREKIKLVFASEDGQLVYKENCKVLENKDHDDKDKMDKLSDYKVVNFKQSITIINKPDTKRMIVT